MEGVVHDTEGKPVPGAWVRLRTWDEDSTRVDLADRYAEVLTDRRGRYRFVGVEPGVHSLQFDLDDDHRSTSNTDTFVVTAGKRVRRDH